MARKTKGINAERELIHLLWSVNFAAIRVAGSGSSRYPSPDILAGNGLRKLGIECKSIAADAKYIPKDEIFEFKTFCDMFGCEPWIGIRFARKDWHFLSLEDLRDSGKSYAITKELAQMKGLLLSELIK